jgi:hypothetical protein
MNHSETSFVSDSSTLVRESPRPTSSETLNVQSDWDYPDVRFQGSKQVLIREHALAQSWIDSHQNYCLSDGYSFTKQVQTSLKNIQTYAIEKGWWVPKSASTISGIAN